MDLDPAWIRIQIQSIRIHITVGKDILTSREGYLGSVTDTDPNPVFLGHPCPNPAF